MISFASGFPITNCLLHLTRSYQKENSVEIFNTPTGLFFVTRPEPTWYQNNPTRWALILGACNRVLVCAHCITVEYHWRGGSTRFHSERERGEVFVHLCLSVCPPFVCLSTFCPTDCPTLGRLCPLVQVQIDGLMQVMCHPCMGNCENENIIYWFIWFRKVGANK